MNVVKRILHIALVAAMILAMAPAIPIAIAEESNHYAYQDIVKRTYDMSYLATKPRPGEGGQEVTSTDPSAIYNEATGQYENWDANADNTGYVGVNPDNGYRILADLEGPGYLNHIWTTCDWEGTLHIWIDGKLVVDMPFCDFVHGYAFEEFGELSFKANEVEMNGFEYGYQGAINLNVPITYNESCRVEINCDIRSSFYYYIGYYNLEDGATVEPFTWPMSDANRAALREANAILADTSVPAGDANFVEEIAAGETVTIYESGKSGALTGFSLDLNIPEEEFDDQTSLWIGSSQFIGTAAIPLRP